MASNMASKNEKTHILVTKNDTEACNTVTRGPRTPRDLKDPQLFSKELGDWKERAVTS